ncbi:DUF2490 domain-containing protein [Yeosuana sp. MJ-SS3]|uniref:DUF2490 domain-containing protein n=1 Tax=Gilvirhabdus luticola TaxID=3079858 RepID=A0ABU3U750_9FLAO|nr:DUF2490 domain-containing protein [Yeosuana sp. MJ-SS3]MDU8886225.1 DUF2490 domain-containing protein [Yeosuana sp. MJ-SS3]
MSYLKNTNVFLVGLLLMLSTQIFSQNEENTGARIIYFYYHKFEESNFGIQGDVQYQDWEIFGDFNLFLVRSGLTYTPKSKNIRFILGYAFAVIQPVWLDTENFNENRIYQEILFPHRLGKIFHIVHRFRYEQRFIQNQNFRTRFGYNLFIHVPLNKVKLETNALYLSIFNELFINGETDIGNGRTVKQFDRNRTFLGFGYVLNDNIKFQFGLVKEKTSRIKNDYLQLVMQHSF